MLAAGKSLAQVSIVFLLFYSNVVSSLPTNAFIDFGEDAGDTIFFSNDDNTTSIIVPQKFPFYNRLYSTIHINNNGLLSFEAAVQDYTPEDFPVEAPEKKGVGAAFVAPFWADVDTRQADGNQATNRVYFRSTTDSTTLGKIKAVTDLIQGPTGTCSVQSHFKPTWALVATWHEVGYYEHHLDKTNTFQVVVATDGLFSFAIFNYNQIEWVTGDASGGTNGFGGTAAMVGLNAGDGVKYYKYAHSLTDDVVRVATESNVGKPGQFVHRVDDDVDEDTASTSTGNRLQAQACSIGNLCISPPRGFVHSGGVLTVTGPSAYLLRTHKDNTRLRFSAPNDTNYNETYTKCYYPGIGFTVHCPVPLFPPFATGEKNVTLLLGDCEEGLSAKYTVDSPTVFVDGALNIHEEECHVFLATPFLQSSNKGCISWSSPGHLATDAIPTLKGKDVKIVIHFTKESSLKSQMFNEESTDSGSSGSGDITIEESGSIDPVDGWGTVDLNDNVLLGDVYDTESQKATVYTQLTFSDDQHKLNPPPILMFIRVQAEVDGVKVFASTPLVAYTQESDKGFIGQDGDISDTDSAVLRCKKIIEAFPKNPTRSPCPQNVKQAFFDINLEVDPSCVQDSGAPFNCYMNPGARNCFKILDRTSNSYTRQCCYDAKGLLLIKKPGGGLFLQPSPGDTYADHFRKDLWPVLVCCRNLKGPDDICKGFFDGYLPSSGKDYQQPKVGFLFGDPHFRTFDDLPYTFNGLGEYTFVDANNSEIVLQVRTADASLATQIESNSLFKATVIAAVAAQQKGQDRFQAEFNERFGVDIYVNCELISFIGAPVQHFDGFSVSHALLKTANVTFSSGVIMSVTGENEILSIKLTMPHSLKGTTKGLLGTWNNNTADDLTTPDGTVVPSDSSEEDIFHNFGQKWAVDEDSSIFCYDRFDRNTLIEDAVGFIPTFTTPELPAEIRNDAMELCGDDSDCLFDVAVTRNLEVGSSTIQNVQEFNDRLAESAPVVCDPPCENGGECVLANTCSCPFEFTGPHCESEVFKTTQDEISLGESTWSSSVIIPLLLQQSGLDVLDEPEAKYLCIEFLGESGKIYSLLSDACITVNAKYSSTGDITSIGITARNNDREMVHMKFIADECTAKINSTLITSTYNKSGVLVVPNGSGQYQVILPNCELREVEVTIACSHFPSQPNQERLELSFTRLLNFPTTAHGLIGQFWSVPIQLTSQLQSVCPDLTKDQLLVTMSRPNVPPRSFVSCLYGIKWNGKEEECLYAGDSKGYGVIEGKHEEYAVDSLFATQFKYSRFR